MKSYPWAKALLSTSLVLIISLTWGAAAAADATARRKVIIDQDAFGPAGSNMQAILMLLQSKDVEVLGITAGLPFLAEHQQNFAVFIQLRHRVLTIVRHPQESVLIDRHLVRERKQACPEIPQDLARRIKLKNRIQVDVFVGSHSFRPTSSNRSDR